MKITLLTGKTYDIETAVGFPLKVVKSPRAKRLTLRIDQQERLPVLTLPNRCTAKRAVEFVLSYKEWIEQALSKIPETRKFTHGDEICFFGRTLKIVHTPPPALRRNGRRRQPLRVRQRRISSSPG